MLLLLLTASLVMIIVIDRPLASAITQSQQPMEDVYRQLRADVLEGAGPPDPAARANPGGSPAPIP